MRHIEKLKVVVWLILLLNPIVHATTINLDAMHETALALPNIKTIHIAHQGEVIWAQAYNGANLNAVTNIKSASKSLMSALVGIAIKQGIFEGVDQPIAPLLTDKLPAQPDPRLNTITIDHLLSMQAGLEPTSGGSYGRWVVSSNWVETVLALTFVAEVGGELL